MSESLLSDNAQQVQAPAPVAEKGATQATQAQGQETANQAAPAQQASDAQPAQQQPTQYEFKAPEGRSFDDQVIKAYGDIAKELNLPQETAQKMLDKVGPLLQDRQSQQLVEIQNSWVNNSRADKEFGGEKLQENLAVARKALDQFGTTELRALLNESGLENHPEVIRLLYRAGRAISEDRYVGGSPSKSSTPAGVRSFNDHASILYPSS